MMMVPQVSYSVAVKDYFSDTHVFVEDAGITAAANNNDPDHQSDEPDVIPLQISGTVDDDLSKLSANEMMMWGLANLWQQGEEGGYAVRHGHFPVNDFGHPRRGEEDPAGSDWPNFFEKAFPCLFPYGVGGPEAD
jgi:hypothetical protein